MPKEHAFPGPCTWIGQQKEQQTLEEFIARSRHREVGQYIHTQKCSRWWLMFARHGVPSTDFNVVRPASFGIRSSPICHSKCEICFSGGMRSLLLTDSFECTLISIRTADHPQIGVAFTGAQTFLCSHFASILAFLRFTFSTRAVPCRSLCLRCHTNTLHWVSLVFHFAKRSLSVT